jgi:GNAT superfamily N-acetyltransferase
MSARTEARWRPMTKADLPAIEAIALQVHAAYPESDAVFLERLALYPQGCHVLVRGASIDGYVLSHPWHRDSPPGLDSLLEALPADPDCLYIHDIALLPGARGHGDAAIIVEQLAALSKRERLPALALIAVSGTSDFWSRQGFVAQHAPKLATKLASYDADARLMLRRVNL